MTNNRINLFLKLTGKFVASLSFALLISSCTSQQNGNAPSGPAATPPTGVSAPTITIPSSTPYTSSGSSLVISGACTAGYSVTLGGNVVASDVTSPAGALSQTCTVGGTYNFTISKSVDATYALTVLQTDLSLVSSPTADLSWIRNSSAPSAPTITTPATNPYYSNASSVTVSGACTTGLNVTLGGNVAASDVTSPAGSLTTACLGSAYSFTFSKSVDATYNLTVLQTSSGGVNSSTTSQSWTRDTVTPSAPTISVPASSPFYSIGNLTIAGACETGATVNLSGSDTQSVACASSAYTFTVVKADGTYNFSVTQTDLASNTSSASTQQWIRDNSAPTAPTITTPAANPNYSNASSLTVSGACTTGLTVTLGGNVVASDVTSPAGSLTKVCAGSAYSFTFSKSVDASYNINVLQTSLAGVDSSTTSHTWVRDTVAPSAPTVTTPASNPYTSSGNLTLSGSCETNATVNLTGSDTQSVTCAANAYTFTVIKGSDATYNFSIAQTDRAGNSSGTTAQQWIRNSSLPATPTITTPASSPFYSNSSSLTIAGGCVTGFTVTISGSVVASDVTSPAGSLTQVCASSAYSFTLSKSTDATYSFNIKQTNLSAIDSANATQTWIRDTGVPATPTITTPSSNPFYSTGNLVIAGACENSATVNLSGSDTQSVTCASNAYTFTVVKADGTYNFSVTQTDLASNTSSALAQQWIRDNSAPAAPTVTVPAANPNYSNASSLTVSGACTTGLTVTLGGNVVASDVTSPAGSLTKVCAASAYLFTFSKSVDASYNINVLQTSLAGVDSSTTSHNWVRDTVTPSAPTVTTPASNPYYSTGNLTLAGACETGTTVNLTGSDTQAVTCASNSYSFTVIKADGTYNFSIAQTDLASNTSSAATQQWIRDNTAPTAPTITLPVADPYYSNASSLTLSGACTTGLTVTLGGNVVASDVTSPAGSLTKVCASSAYSFTISKSTDATYNLNVLQTSLAGVNSATATRSWIRDTVAPSAPTITAPASSPYTSGGNLTISGACETNATVNLTGSDTQSVTCAASAYSFTVVKASDATYNFSLTQTDLASNTSSARAQQWIRSSAQTAAPVITVPASSPYLSNGNSVTISGTCIAGATVNLGGASSSSMTCTVGNTFSFSPSQATDGGYTYSVTQTVSSNTSTAVFTTWNRDTSAPLTPTITSPAQNPFTSGDSSFIISGNCEASATVNMSGSASGSTVCSALGTFTQSVSASSDATYTYNFSQTDLALNTSGSLAFVWNRDTSIPSTPTITSPTVTPYYSNTSSLTISGACTSGNTVTLGGDVIATDVTTPAGSLTLTCTAGNTYSFTFTKSVDTTYNLNIIQTNSTTLVDSAPATQVWVRDTVTPSAPTITNPSTSPYTASGNLTLAGGCETNATVNLTGNSTQSTTCISGSYSFTIVQAVDATYNFSVAQTDLASNASAGTAQQWIRNSTVPPTPTILNPSTNPYRSISNVLTLSGGCQTGLVVTLSGNVISGEITTPAGSFTQTCVNSGYSFVITKALNDNGIFNLSLKQTSASIDSGAASLQWIFDNTAPLTTITSNPANPNLFIASTFTFTVDDATATSQCKMDAGAYAPCVSPVTYSGLSNASHTFYVRSTDTNGNVEATPASYTWTQSAGNTVALYHFDAATGFAADSGSYSAANNLTNSGATSTTGKFSEGASLASASSQSLGVSATASMATMTAKMTVESWVKFTSLPSSGNKMILASKMSASPQMGWEYGIKRQGSSYQLYFQGSLNGTTVTEIKTGKLSNADVTALTAGFNHITVTWNLGSVRLYIGGVLKATGTIGTAGTATLFNNSSSVLKIGTNASGGSYLNGVIDEVRLSQIARWSATFTAPAAAYIAD